MEICSLCLKKKKLIKKSHIIPDFMYKELYDDNHKIEEFIPNKIANGTGYIKRPSSGVYESNILCEDCDNGLLSIYENYARKLIYGSSKPIESEYPSCIKFRDKSGIEFTEFKNISYQKLKIFLLSILWRASISTKSFFNDINLGPHEEKLRNMILDGYPGEVDDYPILFMTYVNDKTMPIDFISQPKMQKTKDGHTTYLFIIGGMIYRFFINSKTHKIPDSILLHTLKQTNEVTIFHIPKGKGWDYILNYYGLNNKSHH